MATVRPRLPIPAFVAGLAVTAAAAEPPPPSALPAVATAPAGLPAPTEQGLWIRPQPGKPGQAVWGIRGGIRVGLWPTDGPRGLIRIYTPYLGQDPGTIMNFIAVEPVVDGHRGYSEMETSAWDGKQGRLMWSGDTATAPPAPPWMPAAGVEAVVDGVRTLTVVIQVEALGNGARPLVRLRLREDHPHEVEMRVTAAPGSAAMQRCILTATMGNYARLRTLHLAQGPLHVRDMFATPPTDGAFTDHAVFGLERLNLRQGWVVVAATPDEADPVHATYEPGGWRYQGGVATQYWIADAIPGLSAVVNARTTYWQLASHIPGGMAIENFELDAPYVDGQTFRFGITADAPAIVIGR